jgi:hypothetical protein
MKPVLVVLFIVLFLDCCFNTATILNECGGDRSLSGHVGDFCDPVLPNSCTFGILTCASTNLLVCIPDSSITIHDVLDSKPQVPPVISSSERHTASRLSFCENGGQYTMILEGSEMVERCQCVDPFVGDRCEKTNYCYNINCGAFGYCDNGTCRCNSLYTGQFCEIRRDCQKPNSFWTGTSCDCLPGYNSPNCDSCISGLVCLPTLDNQTYTAMVFSNPRDIQIIDKLLTREPPPGYANKPYRPNPSPSSQCRCSTSSSPSLTQTSPNQLIQYLSPPWSSTRRMDRDDDDDRDDRWDHEHGTYLHHFYQHYFHDDDDCSTTVFWVILIFVLVVLFILVCCLNKWPIYRHPLPVVATLPPPPPPPVLVAPPPITTTYSVHQQRTTAVVSNTTERRMKSPFSSNNGR